jgi:chromate transporter
MTDSEFASAYAIGQVAPGPNMLMLMFVGYGLAGFPGVAAAALGFFLPTAAICAAISGWWYSRSHSPWAKAISTGLSPLALGLLFAGLWTVAQASIGDWRAGLIAVAAAGLLLTKRVNPVAIIALAGIAGYFVF